MKRRNETKSLVGFTTHHILPLRSHTARVRLLGHYTRLHTTPHSYCVYTPAGGQPCCTPPPYPTVTHSSHTHTHTHTLHPHTHTTLPHCLKKEEEEEEGRRRERRKEGGREEEREGRKRKEGRGREKREGGRRDGPYHQLPTHTLHTHTMDPTHTPHHTAHTTHSSHTTHTDIREQISGGRSLLPGLPPPCPPPGPALPYHIAIPAALRRRRFNLPFTCQNYNLSLPRASRDGARAPPHHRYKRRTVSNTTARAGSYTTILRRSVACACCFPPTWRNLHSRIHCRDF